ncbi:MAG: pyridoxamine 5'-phosphate oxidase family protein [Hyphomicrobium sp.]|uniref:pyridoxamine 5'-phosphate oxidase family protein n=1 Tax=Hyphomicrobium sp. TaxID=82 RepID=UPI0039E38CFE
MPAIASDVAFTPAVKAEQVRHGSRTQYERMERLKGWPTTVNDDLAETIAETRSFYLATASADGQPYIQHRGGPAGFLKILDEKTLAFADFAGNKQYITVGNLAENPNAYIFIMDYVHQRRAKLWGTAKVVENDEELLTSLSDPTYRARPERAIVFTLEAWDRNCPQHIPRMLPFDDVKEAIGRLQTRIADLEAENGRLRSNDSAAH